MKNIFLIVFCLLVSTVWAKEEKNKRIQYCTTLEEAMQQAARTMLDAAQQVAAAIPAGGIAVDVNVTGNAQASITRGKGSVYSGVSYAQGVAEEMME